jgi:hypothetical protein
MALAYGITTAGVTLNKVWRKSQGKLLTVYQTMVEEWSWLEKLKKFDINISAREITVPVDVKKPNRAAIIPEGGYEHNPSTPGLQEITLSWSNYNDRWTTTITARFLSRLGQDNKVIDQFKYQSLKSIEGLSRTVGVDFYGFSTGILALNTTVGTNTTLTLTLASGYGLAAISNAAFIASLFTIDDRIALVRAGALVTNAIGTITAINAATPSITVLFNGSVTSANGDAVVSAQNVENATLAGGTAFNLALTGLLDITQSASLHGLTDAGWVAGYSDTTGGRFSMVRLRRMRQGINNKGGGKLTDIIWPNGVSNDTAALQAGALRFTNPFNMELDGEATAKGVTFRTSQRVPPTFLFGFDRDSLRSFSLVDFPEEGDTVWNDGDKLQDQNAFVFSVDFPLAMVCTNRANTAYFSGLVEQ